MRQAMIVLSKILFGGVGLLVLAFAAGMVWPLPELPLPAKHHSVLLQSVNIIDVASGEILSKQDILIKGNTIHAIEKTGQNSTKADVVIDAHGKFVIPGLWDMHTHSNQLSPWLHHPLYIANGVTGVRDMSGQLSEKDSYWAGTQERMQWNADLDRAERITPRYVLHSSYQIDGAASVPSDFPAYFKLEDSQDADKLLNFYQHDNTDFIKVYAQIPPQSYRALAVAAPKYGMHIAGHKPVYISLKEAVSLGQKSFEHGRIFMYEAFPQAEQLRTSTNWKRFFNQSKKSMISKFNWNTARDLMLHMKHKQAYWTPTLQTFKFEAFAHEPAFLDNENTQYISYIRKKLWWQPDINGSAKRNRAENSQGVSAQLYELAKQQLKTAHQVGVPILAGTDVGDSYVFAGFSIHEELKALTESGLSPLAALQSATITPAHYAKLDSHFGTIGVGKNADLVLLNKNPLQDIQHTTSIFGVVHHGRYYDLPSLTKLKQFSASVVASWHMNVKILYGMLKSPLVRVQLVD